VSSPRPRSTGIGALTFGALAGICLVLIASLAVATFWSVYATPSERVQAGVKVADVPVGGVAREEVSGLVTARLERYAETQITVLLAGGFRRFRASDLGYRPELAATLAQVEALGVLPKRDAILNEWSGEAQPRAITPAFSIDHIQLAATIDELARSIDQPAVDADLKINPDATIELIPARVGRRLSREELTRRLQATFRGLETEVAVPIEPVPPTIADAEVASALLAAEQMLAGPLEVRAGAHTWTLTRGDLASWIVFERRPTGPERIALGLHPERPRNWLVDRASEIGRPPRDARVRFRGGKLTATAPDEPGTELDRAGALAALRAATGKGERRVELPVKSLKPNVMAAELGKLAFPDLLVEATTTYVGGIPERNHNVELAAARVDGLVVPAGASFSFNRAIGRTRLRDGFKMAYGIQAGDDGVQTVPSVAGGICQVSTTLFHAAFWAGLPIEERHEHPYWIPKYGMPPRGMPGLDATVDEDTGLDFRFKNATAGPMLVQASTDGQRVTFQLFGVKSGWEVTTAGPSLTNFVKADHAFVRQEDATLAAGRAIQVEEARDGFDALVTRRVFKAGALIDELELRSHYAPSRNVVLVGTRR
jgi:vancomycin resistance protein YoaR